MSLGVPIVKIMHGSSRCCSVHLHCALYRLQHFVQAVLLVSAQSQVRLSLAQLLRECFLL